METTQVNSLIASEYVINYYGKEFEIRNYTKVLALFVNGSGYTDHGGHYYGSSAYELYIPNKSDFGKTLIKIGHGQSNYNGNEVSSRYFLNGLEYHVDGLAIDELFNKIFKKS
jgi:hypothetical protein